MLVFWVLSILRARLGYDAEKMLVKEVLTQPHRAYLGLADTQEHEIQTLRTTLKQTLRKELLNEVKKWQMHSSTAMLINIMV